MGLTPRQQRFVDEYLIDLNATQAAIRASYDFGAASGHYTYFLIDPRDHHIFYVGKGTHRRLSLHARRVKSGLVDNPAKCERIYDIQSAGFEVIELVFSEHADELSAYAVERNLIAALRLCGLTNIAGGITTRRESAQLKARIALSKLLSFEDWMASATHDQKEDAKRFFGSERAVYDWVRGRLEHLAEAC